MSSYTTITTGSFKTTAVMKDKEKWRFEKWMEEYNDSLGGAGTTITTVSGGIGTVYPGQIQFYDGATTGGATTTWTTTADNQTGWATGTTIYPVSTGKFGTTP